MHAEANFSKELVRLLTSFNFFNCLHWPSNVTTWRCPCLATCFTQTHDLALEIRVEAYHKNQLFHEPEPGHQIKQRVKRTKHSRNMEFWSLNHVCPRPQHLSQSHLQPHQCHRRWRPCHALTRAQGVCIQIAYSIRGLQEDAANVWYIYIYVYIHIINIIWWNDGFSMSGNPEAASLWQLDSHPRWSLRQMPKFVALTRVTWKVLEILRHATDKLRSYRPCFMQTWSCQNISA